MWIQQPEIILPRYDFSPGTGCWIHRFTNGRFNGLQDLSEVEEFFMEFEVCSVLRKLDPPLVP